ncbi:MAG: hypothetical protein LBV09_02060 [Deferribacteraceae bacterium]|jgi:exonuclease VII small subunit|nr:hypothetical protein [Deferribacteraceae bacterium]
MGTYRINLFKKITIGEPCNSPASGNNDEYFTLLGGFQRMTVTKVKEFYKLVEYPASACIDGVHYCRHTIPIFNADDHQTPFSIGNFFLVSALNLNKSSSIFNVYKSADELSAGLKSAIRTLALRYQECDIHIYADLSTHDFVVAIGSDTPDNLQEVWSELLKIPIPQSEELLFRSSESFLAIRSGYNGDNDKLNELITHIQMLERRATAPKAIFKREIAELDALRKHLYIENKIPLAARRSLDFLVDNSTCMLQTEYKRTSTIRIYKLLKRALTAISESNISGSYITHCLGDLSSIMNASLLSGSLRMDQLSVNDADLIAPTSKLAYAYESVLDKLYKTLNCKEDIESDPIFFITINALKGLSSQSYLSDGKKHGAGRIISVNFPSTNFFDMKMSVPYIIHEAGHYIHTHAATHQKRTKAMEDLVASYIKKYVWRHAFLDEKLTVSEKDYKQFISSLLKSFQSVYLFQYELPTRNFTQQCLEYIKFIRQAFNADIGLMEDKSEYEKGLLLRLRLTFNALYEQHGHFVYTFAEAIRESRADIIMCEVCGLNYEQYFKFHYRYLEQNMIENATYNYQYLFRLSAVFIVLSDDKIDEIRAHIKHLNQDESNFLNKVLKFWQDNCEILKSLTGYLQSVRGDVEGKLEKDKEIKRILRLFSVNPSPNFNEAVKCLHDEWYEGLLSWEKRNDEYSKQVAMR